MEQRKIEPVKNSKDKQITYRENINKYNKALKNGFYFEALLIDYALIEDRLRSLLYHMAFLANTNNTKAWEKTCEYFKSMVFEYKDAKENDNLGISNISGKIKIIRCVFLWASNVETGYSDDRFLVTLKRCCESVDIQVLLDAFKELSEWCGYRNEIIHSLLNKNINSVSKEIEDRVIQGMKIARYLDTQVRIIKKGNAIRKSINASLE